MSFSPADCSRAVGALLLLVLLGTQVSAVANAQSDYDPNCNRVTYTEAERVQQEFLMTHAGARLVATMGDNACKALELIRNFGKASPSGEINNDILMDSATPDFPTTSTGERILENVRNAASKGYGAVGQMLKLNEREVGYAETVPLEGGLRSGSLISSTGMMARGTFDASYKLSGSGQLITPDGKVRAGEFSNNQLRGEGFIAEKDGNRTVLIEGTFDGDTPVGEVIRNYADGSRVRELWENGRMVARGGRAPKGSVPPKISRPDVAPLAYHMGMHEGPYLQVDGPRERFLLACNQQIIAVGEWGASGKAPPPSPSACPNPERYRGGYVTVRGVKWPQARAEYWCNGKMVAATPYANYPPQQYVKPEPKCIKEASLPMTPASAFRTGNMIERTLEPSKTRPVASTGRVLNPLIVQGPPWPCADAIGVYMQAVSRRTQGRGLKTPQGYWNVFGNSPVRLLLDGFPSITTHGHDRYLASVPGAHAQPVVFTINGYQFREGFFRNAQSMRALSASFEAGRQSSPGDEWGAGLGLNACVARYLAENARD